MAWGRARVARLGLLKLLNLCHPDAAGSRAASRARPIGPRTYQRTVTALLLPLVPVGLGSLLELMPVGMGSG